MAKNSKGEEGKPEGSKKSINPSEEEPVLNVNAAAAELEQDELVRIRLEKKAAEEEGIGRVIRDVTGPKRPALNSVSLENFDWDAYDQKGFGEGYSKADRENLKQLYSGTITTVSNAEVVKGIVVGINERDVILNIGFKSDGLVPLAEFKDQPSLKIGDEVDLFIEERENAIGQLVVSRRKAKLVKGWEYLQNALDKDEVIEGFVKRRTKGGLIGCIRH